MWAGSVASRRVRPSKQKASNSQCEALCVRTTQSARSDGCGNKMGDTFTIWVSDGETAEFN